MVGFPTRSPSIDSSPIDIQAPRLLRCTQAVRRHQNDPRPFDEPVGCSRLDVPGGSNGQDIGTRVPWSRVDAPGSAPTLLFTTE